VFITAVPPSRVRLQVARYGHSFSVQCKPVQVTAALFCVDLELISKYPQVKKD